MSDTIENRAALTGYIERIEALNEDRSALGDDIRELYTEAKGEGFDTRVMRKLIALRKQDKAKRIEMETMLDLYAQATGTDL